MPTVNPPKGSWGELCLALRKEFPNAEYIDTALDMNADRQIWESDSKEVVAGWHSVNNEGYTFRIITLLGSGQYRACISGKIWTEEEAIAAATMAQKYINEAVWFALE